MFPILLRLHAEFAPDLCATSTGSGQPPNHGEIDWFAAHDLVSRYVQPTLASHWVPERRVGRDETDPKAWVTLVHPDEFPLGMFFQALRSKLAPVVEGVEAA